MIPMPQPATNVFAQRMGVPPQPQPTFGSNPPMHLPMTGGGPPMWGGQAPMAGPISPVQPVQGPMGFNPQPQPVGPAPYQPLGFGQQPGNQQPGIMQDPNVQNFLRRRLMGMPGMGAQF